MKELLEVQKQNMILMAILTILLGLILIIWPASSTMFICLVAGWLLLRGDLSVVIYFSSQEAGPSSALFLGAGCCRTRIMDCDTPQRYDAVYSCIVWNYLAAPRFYGYTGFH